MNENIVTELTRFFNEALRSLQDGLVFFGGPLDYVRYVVDILLITVFIYSILRILRETRAWQLLKGIALILFVAVVCILLQMEMVTFIFTNILSLVAIALVVIFQPELRRALESVGLRTFFSSTISSAIAPNEELAEMYTVRLIDQVVDASVKMSETYTGALIIFERTSKLSDLMKQENAVTLDASVTSTMLQSIFYKGSPLHDGALLIQNGRISAARCHIPLSENAPLKEGLGTRHRAALGASEYGDAVAIAISEERGTISLALNGVLYQMKNAEELKKNLLYLFGVSEVKNYSFGQRIKDRYQQNKKEHIAARKNKKKNKNKDGELLEASSEQNVVLDSEKPIVAREKTKKSKGTSRLQKVFLMLLSLVFSLSLWLYIQVTTNPVVPNKTVVLTLSFQNEQVLEEQNLSADYPYTTITVSLSGRKKELDKIASDPNEDFKAYIDFAETTEPGVYTYDIQVISNRYFNIKTVNPESFVMTIYEEGEQ